MTHLNYKLKISIEKYDYNYYLPRSSEKLIPSLIFPPTTQNKIAPLISSSPY